MKDIENHNQNQNQNHINYGDKTEGTKKNI